MNESHHRVVRIVESSSKDRKEADLTPSVTSANEQQTDVLRKKTANYVLVYIKNDINDEAFGKIETFVYNLEQKGFELETAPLSGNDEINFIKIYAPQKVLLHFAEIFGIELAFQNENYRCHATKPFKCIGNEVTLPNINSPIYQRARDTLSESRPSNITSAESGLIIHKVLTKNAYGDEIHEYGVQKLINQGVLESAYPLHDGDFRWTEEGPLNDRQLLAEYWSNLKKNWYKQQPLDLIEKYYGPETSFYFAWLGFYNKMLIPASVTGLLFFLVGIAAFMGELRSEEVCSSDLYLCPRCLVPGCKHEPLKNSCFHAQLIYVFDNPLVIAFAALMSVWSTVFLELWKREEAMLQIRWNLRSVEADYSMRPEFEEKATHRRISHITSQEEPYMPKKVLCCRYTITTTSILLLVILMLLGIFGVMIYVKAVSTALIQSKKIPLANVGLIASTTGSLISVTFILVFELLYEKIAKWLTDMENPRTQMDYDNSMTYKSYAMAFVNNYSVIFYIAFMKARFYTYPGDKAIFETLEGIASDLCDPAGCIIELGIQVVMVLLAKNLVMTAKQYVVPQILICINKFRKRKQKGAEFDELLQWESDYFLNLFEKNHIMGEYIQMVIQYGFVTFFVAAFPAAPLLALFNNVIELRVDAYKLTTTYRRPVAHKVPNVAAWNGILQGVTYIGIATNAFVIAFTSEFVQRLVYRSDVRSDLRGYINSTLSVYNTSEFSTEFEPTDLEVCYYPGKRYPPDHPERYELTHNYWYNLTIKFIAVVVFEHIIMLVTGVVAYVIPDIPFSVKEHINYQRDQFKQLKTKALHEAYLKKQEKEKTNIFAAM